MFCRNCGKELTGTPEICLGCGAKPLVGSSFCHACGAETNPLAEICIKCGVRLAKAEVVGRRWMPTAAGILSIIAGAIGLLVGVVVAAVGEIVGEAEGIVWFGAISAPFIGLGIVAIIGGVFALRRRIWGLALAGAICSLCFPPYSWFLAIPAIVFVALSKREFV
jgi:hypothetical protein